MFKFFRKVRQKLLIDNKVKKYFIYAFGEIILVVLGILIALYINNKNELNKKEAQIETIYQRVFLDIDSNIKNAENIIKEYKEIEFLFQNIRKDSATRKDFNNGLHLVTTALDTYSADITGINQLKNLNVNNERSVKIIRIYDRSLGDLKAVEKVIFESVTDNLNSWKKDKKWFSKYIHHKLSKEAQNYFLKSEDYKNRMAYSYLLIYDGYLSTLNKFANDLKNWKKEFKK